MFDYITNPNDVTKILLKVKDYFIEAAMNLHGSRSMQRLVKACTTNEQVLFFLLYSMK